MHFQCLASGPGGEQLEEHANTRQAPCDNLSPPLGVRGAMGNSHPGGSRLMFGLKQKVSSSWVIKMSSVPDLWKARGILPGVQMGATLGPWFMSVLGIDWASWS